MNFTPKTEKEVSRLFDKGDYKFEITAAEETQDRKGNPMLHIKLSVFHNITPGKIIIVDVWLTDNPNFEFLLRHFAYSIGLEESYERGILEPRQCIGRKGIVRLGISKDKNNQYPDKNNAVDFIVSNNVNTDKNISIPYAEECLNDDLPF